MYSRYSFAKLLHWAVTLKVLGILLRRGGEAPVEEVERELRRVFDETTARAWRAAVIVRNKFAVEEQGVLRLTDEGARFLRNPEALRLAREVRGWLSLYGIDPGDLIP